VYGCIAAIVVFFDQFTKYYIRKTMALGESIPMIKGGLHLTYVHNYGAAFSILQNRQALLISLTATIIIVITAYVIKYGKTLSKSEMTGLALITGGGFGNLIDRIRYGYVVDFLNIHILPVFNVADMAVCAGSALLIYSVFLSELRHSRAGLR